MSAPRAEGANTRPPRPDGAGQKRTLVIVLCGIPGSGKSTVAAQLIRQLGDVEVIATDVIGGRSGRYERLRRRLAELAGRRRYVVLDGTFYSRQHRETVRGMGHPVLLAYLRCPLDMCLERNRGRRGAIPDRGVVGIARRFEAPADEEWPLLIPADRTDPEAAARLIYRAILQRAFSQARLRIPHTRAAAQRASSRTQPVPPRGSVYLTGNSAAPGKPQNPQRIPPPSAMLTRRAWRKPTTPLPAAGRSATPLMTNRGRQSLSL